MTTVFDAARACGLSLATSETRGWLTAYEHSSAISRELDAGDTTFALRLLRQAVEDLDYLIDMRDERALEQFLAQPPATGDTRWGTLLSLALTESCRRHGMTPPPWGEVQALPEPFFPSRPSRRFIARTIERTLTPFAEANVWIDSRDLAYA